MNPDIQRLQPYPFEKLRDLKQGIEPAADLEHINLSVGEPRHAAPAFVREAIAANLDLLERYPLTGGSTELREAVAAWLSRRHDLPGGLPDPGRHIAPVNGTREGLSCVAQALVDHNAGGQPPLVLLPNPFYQIYEGAALLAGAEPWYYPAGADGAPDFDAVPEAVWRRCAMMYLCSPGNPTGHVLDRETLASLLERAERFDFVIVSDECYSEIYFDEDAPPPGLLQAAFETGRAGFERCLVFNSLSKRSNLPGLRSGFVAGDAALMKPLMHYRTYHGSAMPGIAQQASIAVWSDEAHVKENRERYRRKFRAFLDILAPVWALKQPQGSFFLWAPTPEDDRDFTRALYREQNITVLPGSYLSRPVESGDPGRNRVRIALVGSDDECLEAARRLHEFLATR